MNPLSIRTLRSGAGDHPTQKLINAGADVVDEMLEGILAAHGDSSGAPTIRPGR